MRIHFVMVGLGATHALAAGCAEAEELEPSRQAASTSSGFAVTPGTGGASTAGGYATTSVDGSGGMAVAGSGGGGGTPPEFDASNGDAYFDSAPAVEGSMVDAAIADARPEAVGDAASVLRDITFLYKCMDTNPADAQIGPSYRLVEMANSTVSLADFRIRYYLTNESKVALLSDYLYAEVNGGPGYRDIRSNASVTFASLTPPRPGADAYVDVTFNAGAGTLTSGQVCTVNFVVHTPGFATNLNESDDYSHDLSKTDFGPNTKITVYYKDQLALGVEP